MWELTVNRELVTFRVFRLEDVLTGDCPGSDNEEGGLEVILVQVLEEPRCVRRWSVIETSGAKVSITLTYACDGVPHTPGKLFGAGRDVAWASALATSPPADGS